MERIDTKTADLTAENEAKLLELFPQVATEVEDENGEIKRTIDFDALRKLLGDVAEGQRERYQFVWPGKASSREEARKTCDNTLIPEKDKSVDWDKTENLYIEGDNLTALKLLKETYAGKIKLIYIDPPYNTGSDLIYDDDFASTLDEYQKESGEYDATGGKLVSNLEGSGRFHSDWCSMIFPRLLLARDLLAKDGVIFISIDDNELANLIKICDSSEVFGAANFIGILPRVTKKSGKNHSDTIARNHDYVAIYARDASAINFNGIEVADEGFTQRDEYFNERGPYKVNQTLDYDSLWYNPKMDFPITVNGVDYYPGGSKELSESRHAGNHAPKDWVWRWSQAKFDFGYPNGFIEIKEGRDRPRIYTKTYKNASIEKDDKGNYYVAISRREMSMSSLAFVENEFSNDNAKKNLDAVNLGSNFDFSKPLSLIEKIESLVELEDGDLVLDFFAGSSTTAAATLQYIANGGARINFIMVQIPEETSGEYSNLCEIGEERIRRAGAKVREEVEEANRQLRLGEEPRPVPDTGFRVLRIDSSNFRDAKSAPDGYDQATIFDYADNLKEGRTPLDILFQVLPAFRIPYSAKIDEVEVAGKQAFVVNDGQLVACFDVDLTNGCIEEIARMEPVYAVFRDASLADDATAANLEELFKTYSPDTVRRVI